MSPRMPPIGSEKLLHGASWCFDENRKVESQITVINIVVRESSTLVQYVDIPCDKIIFL